MSGNQFFIIPAMLLMSALVANAEEAAPEKATTNNAPASEAPANTSQPVESVDSNSQPKEKISKKVGSGPNPFRDCGIGAALFPNTAWAAVTSNVIWDVGTTAVTSATASPQTCSGEHITAAAFINNNYDQLAEETARGEGEHLTTIMNMFHCDSAHHVQAIGTARKAMGSIVAQPDYAIQNHIDKSAEYYDVIESAVSMSCSV